MQDSTNSSVCVPSNVAVFNGVASSGWPADVAVAIVFVIAIAANDVVVRRLRSFSLFTIASIDVPMTSPQRRNSTSGLSMVRYSAVSMTNLREKTAASMQKIATAMLGSMNGYVVMSAAVTCPTQCRLQVNDHMLGYCLMGSANRPPMAGPSRNPQLRIPTTSPIARFSKTSSPCPISDARVFAVPAMAFDIPRHVRNSIAMRMLVARPNRMENTADSSIDACSTTTRPYTSATRPQLYAVKNRPTMNVADRKPAYVPTDSVVASGIRCSTMYPE
mmetsp:Transcript_19446/g.54984  ORF Transcript_19446/g.54984 Transcript_19446/m.54984 type:complete len:275 (+) Transcript_19446:818-1642(+)